jgi:hypothetical protein
MLSFSFYPEDQNGNWKDYAAVGTYDLGTGNNANYSTCNQCVNLSLYNSDSYALVKSFFQQKGTLQITKTDFSDDSYPYYKGTVTVKLAEATINDSTYESTFTPNGDCYEIESAAWSNFQDDADSDDPTDPTNPTDPTDPTNPTDPTDPTNPPAPVDCTGLSIEWDDFTFGSSSYTWYVGEDPRLSMEFWGDTRTAPTVGDHDLGTGDNTNYKTCTECVLIRADVVDGSYTKFYFQKEGNLKIDSFDDDTNAIKGSISAKFAEVEIANDATSTFKTNGGCFEIESGSFECVPECGDRVCGPNGCGGTCGECEGQACNAEGQCVDYECEDLSFDPEDVHLATSSETAQQYYYAITNEAGSTSLYDMLIMEFYGQNSSGYFYPTNFADVVAVTLEFYEDMYNPSTDAYLDNYKTFINQTLTFDDISYIPDTMQSAGSASFRLEEVDSRYVPVPGGKCYDVDNFSWDLTE